MTYFITKQNWLKKKKVIGQICGSDLVTTLTKQNDKCLLNVSIKHILCLQEHVCKFTTAILLNECCLECTADMCAWLMVEADVLICEKLENCLALAQLPLMMSLSSLVGGSIILRSLLSTPSACDIHTNLALTQTSHTNTVFLTQMHIEELLKIHHKLAWGTSRNLFCPVSPFIQWQFLFY